MQEFSSSLKGICKNRIKTVMTTLYQHVRDSTADSDMVLCEFQNALTRASRDRRYPDALSAPERQALARLLERTEEIAACRMSIADVWHNLCVYTARETWRKPYVFDHRYRKCASSIVDTAIDRFAQHLWDFVTHAPQEETPAPGEPKEGQVEPANEVEAIEAIEAIEAVDALDAVDQVAAPDGAVDCVLDQLAVLDGEVDMVRTMEDLDDIHAAEKIDTEAPKDKIVVVKSSSSKPPKQKQPHSSRKKKQHLQKAPNDAFY